MALWAPFFSFFLSLRPRESSSLPFIWFSWVGPPCLVDPILISCSLVSPNPLFEPPRSGPHDPAPLWSQQDIPGVSALSLIISWLSLHLPLHQQSDRPPTHMCIQTCDIQIDTYRALMYKAGEMKDVYGIVKSLGLFRKFREPLLLTPNVCGSMLTCSQYQHGCSAFCNSTS